MRNLHDPPKSNAEFTWPPPNPIRNLHGPPPFSGPPQHFSNEHSLSHICPGGKVPNHTKLTANVPYIRDAVCGDKASDLIPTQLPLTGRCMMNNSIIRQKHIGSAYQRLVRKEAPRRRQHLITYARLTLLLYIS